MGRKITSFKEATLFLASADDQDRISRTYGIPAELWSTVVQRVLEQKEPLRSVAAAYGVSHEMIRRIMLHVQKQGGQLEV